MRDTYLAKDITALDAVAKTFEIHKNLKATQAYKAADKLHTCIKQETEDEEKAYVHLTRYILMFDYLFQIEPDKKYLELMYGNTYKDAKKRHNDLRANLINRYQSLRPIENITKKIDEIESVPIIMPKDTNLFGPDKYINCQQLYKAHGTCKNILIMDVRPAEAFRNSHLKEFTVININDAVVQQGLSANKLGEKLPNDVKEVYDKRDSFDYIILLDFDSTQDTYKSSKLRILYSILTEWDINTIYKHSPNILEGGYVDFIDRYPSLSTNPNTLLRDKNQALDELLDLEAIVYPDEVTTVKAEEINRMDAAIDRLYQEILDITTTLLNIEEKLVERHLELYDDRKVEFKDKNNSVISDLTNDKMTLQNKKKEVEVTLKAALVKRPREDIEKKRKIRDIEYRIVSVSRHLRIMKQSRMNQIRVPPYVQLERVPEPIGDRPSVPTPREQPSTETPTINRATKPKTLSPKPQSVVLVGLTNIRNTCYMNSVIQCIRHLPSIRDFFLSGRYLQEITTDHPTLIHETAELINMLCVPKTKAVCPTEFYRKVISLNPLFKRGNHEDANEFFMCIYNYVLDDTATPISRNKYDEAKYQTFYDQIQYKMSFFVKDFYYQIRTDCVCSGCGKKGLKYDIETSIMVSVPSTGTTSVEELYDEFMRTCDISNFFCRKCERKGDIVREFSYQPKVMTILLKRYSYINGFPEKITIPCDFPLDNFRMGRAIYKLWSISLHQGGVSAGHYTAVCLNSQDGIWYEFNDDYVKPVDINSPSIKERSYMFFYESEDGSETGF